MVTILLAFEAFAVTFPGSKHEVGRCRETVAGGESKAARVSPGPRTLDPGPGTGTPSTADCSPRGPTPRLCAPLHRWETASPIAGNPPTFNLDGDDSPGTPSNGKGQPLRTITTDSRFQCASRGFGVIGLAAGGFTTHFPCNPADSMHPRVLNKPIFSGRAHATFSSPWSAMAEECKCWTLTTLFNWI